MLSSQVQSLRKSLAEIRGTALERHRRAESPFHVVAGLAGGVDSILSQLFTELLGDEADHVALLAVGGYGRRELCPQSDIDVLFLRQGDRAAPGIERMVRLLWDGGFQLGHSVRTPEQCYEFMKSDLTTANTMLESRFLAGSERLHDRFLTRALHRYRRRKGAAFTRGKLDLLRQSLEDPQRTIYVVEPNVKEGICGLRDIQRILWIENLNHRGDTFEALLQQGRFSPVEVRNLKDAYGFYLRLRCELHFANDVRQDILQHDSVREIAVSLGYLIDADDQAAVEALMGDYYRHARHVYCFLRLYLQTSTQGRSLLHRVSRRLYSTRVSPRLSLYKGYLYLNGAIPESVTPEVIMEIFEIAQKRNVRLSETLCEWIRRQVADLDTDFTHRPEAIRGLRAILRGPRVGQVLKVLHVTGVLDRTIPEFARLDCLVHFDGHHQFTVDEHTLKTLEELDRVENDPDYPEQDFRKLFLEIKTHLPLRIALLLHDVGKAIPGKHSVSSTEAAVIICERLGLDQKSIDAVEFLVYRHLELFRVSEMRNFSEEGVLDSLARLVGTEERLKMLYLLTYLDIVSVGPGTWTGWKGAQLAELYQRTLIHLQAGNVAGDFEVQLSSGELNEEERQKVRTHCGLMGTPGYVREILPERMLSHVALVENFCARDEMQVALETFVGYHDVTFCGRDRPGLFADLTGLLLSEGFNVLGGRIFSRSDGIVIDLFQVELADTVLVPVEKRVDRLRAELEKVQAEEEGVEDFIRLRPRRYKTKRWRRPLFGPSVRFDNDSSEVCTVVEVTAGDRPGLLFDLACGLHRLGLDVRTAKVSTLTDRAHDVFYVVEGHGGKVTSTVRKDEIAQALVSIAKRPVADL
jgi:[protein-PII] uridylyltransferase